MTISTLRVIAGDCRLLMPAQGPFDLSLIRRCPSSVLAAIDAIEALDIDPADVAPEHWRHLNHRIGVNEPFRIYSHEQHHAWLLRREVSR